MNNLIICMLYYVINGNRMEEDEMCGACSTHREVKNAYKILVE